MHQVRPLLLTCSARLQITSWGSSEMPEQDDFPSLGKASAPGGPTPSQAQPRPTGAWGTGGLTSSRLLCNALVNTAPAGTTWCTLWKAHIMAVWTCAAGSGLVQGFNDLELLAAQPASPTQQVPAGAWQHGG